MRNVYRADARDMHFVIWEQLGVEQHVLSAPMFREIDKALVVEILGQARKLAYRELGTRYQSSDREGCRLLPDGRVQLPAGYEAAWAAHCEGGWGRIGLPADEGGLGVPYVATMPVQEMFCGANPGFATLHGFCAPLYFLVRRFGSPMLQQLFCEPLADNRWSACLCMTEPGAGTDVGNIACRAEVCADGSYAIRGGKIFISAGSHDLAENIVYVVLARIAGAPAGTLGLSCFLVPRRRIGADGAVAGDNHVRCVRLEDKMGLHGCPTAQLSFGEDGECVGYLLGERPNLGLQQLRMMMNQARIATGVYALGLASSAYLNAAEYADGRIQGADFRQMFNPRAPRLPIIAHADVRRMLLEMKCKVEGCRALIYKLAFHVTQAQIAETAQPADAAAAERHHGLVNLLTPLAKAYTSDQAWRIAELAIQVHGGYGYTREYPVEQYARDIKILSIWEGTNHIQAVDLVRDKLGLGSNPKLFRIYVAEIEALLARPELSDEPMVAKLREALQALARTVDQIAAMVRDKKLESVLLVANRFLSMISTVTMAWLLLDAAVIARRAMQGLVDGHPDLPFYRGKILSARFFFGQFLSTVGDDAACILAGDDSALDAGREVFLERLEAF